MTKIEQLKKIFLEQSRVTNIEKGYIVAEHFNITIKTTILKLLAEVWADEYRDEKIDAIVGLPQAGTALATALALELGAETILPTRKYALPGSWQNVVTYHADSFTNGVDRVPSYLGGIISDENILMVDDVAAHGTTGVAAIKALQKAGVNVVGLAVIFDKIWQGGVERIQEETGVPVHSLIRISEITSDGQIKLLE